MRIAVYRRFGPPDVLEVGERPLPEPRRGQIRVRVRAAALNPKDVLLRKGRFPLLQGRRFPKSTAHDFAGEVEALGPGVRSPAVGTPVLGMQNGFDPRSAAEAVCVSVDELAPIPPGLDFEGAASLPLAGLTALQALRDEARLEAGMRVVIRGASGGVGTLAVQIARALGAQVTGICSAANRTLVEALGAETVIAYDEEDPLARLRDVDVFFDVFGNLGFARARPTLCRTGTYVGTLPRASLVRDRLLTALTRPRARLVVVRSRRADLEALAGWAEAGALRPVIDSTYPLDAVVDAHRRVETRRSRGKVVVRVTSK